MHHVTSPSAFVDVSRAGQDLQFQRLTSMAESGVAHTFCLAFFLAPAKEDYWWPGNHLPLRTARSPSDITAVSHQ